VQYLAELGKGLTAAKELGAPIAAKTPAKIAKLVGELESSIESLETASAHHGAADLKAECAYLCANVLPAMLKVRAAADALEGLVSDDLWPLPTYQEMLFMR
jgi:glutamine synthetase